MREMRVLRLAVHAWTREPVLLLGEIDGDRCLPVFLHRAPAEVIAAGAGTSPSRSSPGTCSCPSSRVSGTGSTAPRPRSLRDGRLSADLVFDSSTRVPVRRSDALAVAVRYGLPIGVADEILDDVGQPITDLFPDGTDAPPDQQLHDFREFLDDVSPDDFGSAGR